MTRFVVCSRGCLARGLPDRFGAIGSSRVVRAGWGCVERQRHPLDDLTSYPIYAPGSWWARDIRNSPVDPDSDAILRFIGGEPLHPDFGPPPFGIPYVTVSSNEPLVPIAFVAFPEESDEGGTTTF